MLLRTWTAQQIGTTSLTFQEISHFLECCASQDQEFPIDFANPVREDISQFMVFGQHHSRHDFQYIFHPSLLFLWPYSWKKKINHVTLCKSNAVLTTEIAHQSRHKKIKKKTKEFLIWISSGLNRGQVRGVFGKGYVVQSRKLSKQQCDELGSRFKASAHL